MKICIAQIKPVAGDILQNIAIHKKYVELAVSFGIDAIFFPELSLTGYETTLAQKLAVNLNDKRLHVFQEVSDSDQYLHEDEEPYFISGNTSPILRIKNQKIAIAICYEISVPAHCKTAYESGPNIYLASVAKSKPGVEKALDRLSQIANNYSMTILMANCIGLADGNECTGNSSVWNDRCALLAQLDDSHEGILILDTETQMVSEII